MGQTRGWAGDLARRRSGRHSNPSLSSHSPPPHTSKGNRSGCLGSAEHEWKLARVSLNRTRKAIPNSHWETRPFASKKSGDDSTQAARESAAGTFRAHDTALATAASEEEEARDEKGNVGDAKDEARRDKGQREKIPHETETGRVHWHTWGARHSWPVPAQHPQAPRS